MVYNFREKNLVAEINEKIYDTFAGVTPDRKKANTDSDSDSIYSAYKKKLLKKHLCILVNSTNVSGYLPGDPPKTKQ